MLALFSSRRRAQGPCVGGVAWAGVQTNLWLLPYLVNLFCLYLGCAHVETGSLATLKFKVCFCTRRPAV